MKVKNIFSKSGLIIIAFFTLFAFNHLQFILLNDFGKMGMKKNKDFKVLVLKNTSRSHWVIILKFFHRKKIIKN